MTSEAIMKVDRNYTEISAKEGDVELNLTISGANDPVTAIYHAANAIASMIATAAQMMELDRDDLFNRVVAFIKLRLDTSDVTETTDPRNLN